MIVFYGLHVSGGAAHSSEMRLQIIQKILQHSFLLLSLCIPLSEFLILLPKKQMLTWPCFSFQEILRQNKTVAC